MTVDKCWSCKGTGKEDDTDCVICNGNGYETEYKDYPTCPYCGHQQTDDYYDVRSGEWRCGECGECGKTCEVEVEHRMEFTTTRQEGGA